MAINMAWWGEPVPVRRGGVTHQVNSARRAAEMLLYDWPTPDTDKARAARHACLKALEGTGDVKTAREAFAAAVEERRSQHR